MLMWLGLCWCLDVLGETVYFVKVQLIMKELNACGGMLDVLFCVNIKTYSTILKPTISWNVYSISICLHFTMSTFQESTVP